jgi:DNA modification methylase
MIDVGKVGMVPISSISVSDRTREIMGDLDSLEANMKETGLISPLAVRDNKDGTYKLLAGERRFTILKRNEVTEIPARIYDRDLSDLEMKIIEKSENFFRKDMEYYELDKLTLEIHRMQQSLHGVKSPGPGQSGWSTEDTGDFIGGLSKATISMSIKRAEAREAMPELFDSCKTASDASTLLKKMDEAIIKQAIAKTLESKTDDKLINRLSKAFIIRNFFEGIKEFPKGVIHIVEIDPPYGIDLAHTKRHDGESQYQLTDYNEIKTDIYMNGDPNGDWKGINTLFKECYRVMADHSWLICWFAMEPWFNEMYKAILNAGFKTTRMCGIWSKGFAGQDMNPQIRLASSYEAFFYAWKGQPALNKPGRANDFRFSPVPAQQKVHPTERPIELMKEIYDTFAFPGSRILIPFLGSGNGLIAAHQLGMTAVGFEMSKAYKDSFLVKVHGIKEGK